MKAIEGLIVCEGIVFVLFIGILVYATKFVNFFEVESHTNVLVIMVFYFAASFGYSFLLGLRLAKKEEETTVRFYVSTNFFS